MKSHDLTKFAKKIYAENEARKQEIERQRRADFDRIFARNREIRQQENQQQKIVSKMI